MPTRLVLHIGDPKTGSTSIQSVLDKGKFKSPGVRLAYPIESLNHRRLVEAINEGKAKAYLDLKEVKRIQQAWGSGENDHVVISAEQFWTSDPEQVERAIEEIIPGALQNARLLVYIRPHVDRMLSSWQQRIRMGAAHDRLEAFHQHTLQQGDFLYFNRLSKWRTVFGDRLEIRPFIRDRLYKGDVVEDFFAFVLGPDNYEITAGGYENESISIEQLSMIREMQMALTRHNAERGSKLLGRFLWRHMISMPVTSNKKTRLAIHASMVPELISAYGEDARRMDEAFFEGTPLTDALMSIGDKAVPEPQSLAAEDLLSPREVKVLRAWTEMLARMVSLAPAKVAKHLESYRR